MKLTKKEVEMKIDEAIRQRNKLLNKELDRIRDRLGILERRVELIWDKVKIW